ncbi:TPA: hypothetical protein JLQ25_000092 [Escherichia coli]|uniref:hypothetical protein n=1 Tax=Escherichia coli TaxID=562 RepID=UPI00203CA7BA|nr:hypothetical protein [Escherichia coli]HAP3736105.1 hypothetical protein [Escherichia coli]HAW2641198.1 hypothetical protein [Escherichia coli]HAW2948112.1 hypothetical protein [Escherichia coli]
MRDLVLWNIVILLNIYIPDCYRKGFFHALFLQIFLYGMLFRCGLIHKNAHLVSWLEELLVDVSEPGSAG